jgi:hypothetical protein
MYCFIVYFFPPRRTVLGSMLNLVQNGCWGSMSRQLLGPASLESKLASPELPELFLVGPDPCILLELFLLGGGV